MNNIHIFSNNSFGELRVIVKDGKEWFCLSDTCKALGISNSRKVKTRLESGDVISSDVSTLSKNQYGEFTRTQTFTFIDEANLYRCIFQSKKAEAKQFQRVRGQVPKSAIIIRLSMRTYLYVPLQIYTCGVTGVTGGPEGQVHWFDEGQRNLSL